MNKCIGIDIAKQTFQVCFLATETTDSQSFENNTRGFELLAAQLGKEDLIAMEATGPYFLSLALYLFDRGFRVSVLNPLVIKHYGRMKLSRTKTDKKDAYLIACYVFEHKPPVWHPRAQHIRSINEKLSVLELLEKQLRMTNNALESLSVCAQSDSEAMRCLKAVAGQQQRQILKLEAQLDKLVSEHYGRSFQALQRIPGIGRKSAILLIAVTGDFARFDSSRQLISYLGLAPRVYESGSSVRGRGHICKMGMSRARRVLYMCSLSAKRYNGPCAAFYARLKSRGKPEKVIRIAIVNKLVRMAFAIVKNQTAYDENYAKNVCF